MSTVPSPPRAHQAAPILCRASVGVDACGDRVLEVISPRTGKKLQIGSGWWSDLSGDRQRLIGRVVKAQSLGRKTEFAPDELKLLVEIEAKIRKATTPLPRGGGHSNSWSVR
jgi:hypothetical protein